MNRADRSRREFLRLACGAGGAAVLWSAGGLDELLARSGPSLRQLLATAPRGRYWTSTTAKNADCAACHTGAKAAHRHERRLVKCQLCAHRCLLEEGQRGRCRARVNAGGELRSLVYGRPIAEHLDPIEKKPFFHFLPGAEAWSLATSGCPLRCRFCQNWQISQSNPEDYDVELTSAATIAARAARRRARVIAFTYNEPTVFIEYLADIARAGREAGLRSVLVSCGFMNEAPLTELIGLLDAIKIDLKGFSPEFYRTVAGAELAPVLRSIRQVAKAGRHLEIVNLVVPTLNDSPVMLTELSKWVAGELGPDVPIHFTRFHPAYQLQNLTPTPVSTLDRARESALKAGVRYAYVGNVPGHPGSNTSCPSCGRICIERSGMFVTAIRMKNGACASCGTRIAGVWS